MPTARRTSVPQRLLIGGKSLRRVAGPEFQGDQARHEGPHGGCLQRRSAAEVHGDQALASVPQSAKQVLPVACTAIRGFGAQRRSGQMVGASEVSFLGIETGVVGGLARFLRGERRTAGLAQGDIDLRLQLHQRIVHGGGQRVTGAGGHAREVIGRRLRETEGHLAPWGGKAAQFDSHAFRTHAAQAGAQRLGQPRLAHRIGALAQPESHEGVSFDQLEYGIFQRRIQREMAGDAGSVAAGVSGGAFQAGQGLFQINQVRQHETWVVGKDIARRLPPILLSLIHILFLTLFVMAPVVQDINQHALQPFMQGSMSIEDAYTRGAQPLRAFMVKQTREEDLALMLELSGAAKPQTLEQVSNVQLIPAFMLSELRVAFQIGFVIFLPFLLIDLIVSSVLMGLGMMMMPPVTVSLPIKILLFVLIDGWGLILRSTIGSFH